MATIVQHASLQMNVVSANSSDDICCWAMFTADSGFKHRPGFRHRFLMRYLCDPSARVDFVLMVQMEDKCIVGGLRIFSRTLRIGARHVAQFGLGEVCTHPDFRGMGIAGTVLSNAMSLIDEQPAPGVSLLHAAATVQPMYAKYGYVPLSIRQGSVTLETISTNEVEGDTGVTQCSIGGMNVNRVDIKAQWPALSALHEATCSRLGLAGFTIRDGEYWCRWIAGAASAWVAGSQGVTGTEDPAVRYAAQAAQHRIFAASCASTGVLLAYACVQKKYDSWKLSDWGCLPFENGNTHPVWTASAAVAFIREATVCSMSMERQTDDQMTALVEGGGNHTNSTEKLVIVPTAILEELAAAADIVRTPVFASSLVSSSPTLHHAVECVGGPALDGVVTCVRSLEDTCWMVRRAGTAGEGAGCRSDLDSVARASWASVGMQSPGQQHGADGVHSKFPEDFVQRLKLAAASNKFLVFGVDAF